MSELSGTLDGVGLPAIVRFLVGLRKTGQLRLSQGDWQGELLLTDGQVTGARLGSRNGLAAIDALLEVMPGASFRFESLSQPAGEPSIHLENESLLIHLDEVAERVGRGQRTLPFADAVAHIVPDSETRNGEGEEPVPLDRSTLQTLIAVDGRRSVREIVAQRGSFDALWHLATLAETGLITLDAESAARPAAQAESRNEPAPPLEPPARTAPPRLEPRPGRDAAPELQVLGHCPKLGFEDDPTSSFGRPTRLHRCFAASTPLPLSLDQQRELCLSDHFGTCPRLPSSQATKPARLHPVETPEAEPPRIVRLPVAGQVPAADREATSEPARLRVSSGSVRRDASAGSRSVAAPLRARLQRSPISNGSATVPTPPQSGPVPAETQPSTAVRPEPTTPAARQVPSSAPGVERFGRPPVRLVVGAGVVLVGLAVAVYLLAPRIGSLFGDDNADLSALPNSSLVAAGTPVADIAGLPPTPAAVNASPATSVGSAAAPEVNGVQATAIAAPARAAAAQPDAAAAQATAVPTTAPASAAPATLFDERFASNDANWPSGPQGPALFTSGMYRVMTQKAGQFVAISAPILNLPSDLVISATFHKLNGPPGGGYGIIVRDQGGALRDGTGQNGQYYVLEAGDSGNVGIWRRDGDHWVDLQPWKPSDAVKTGTATNDLTVRAIGDRLSLSVNGTEVASKTDASFTGGLAGVFVGGDGNQVALTHFAIQVP